MRRSAQRTVRARANGFEDTRFYEATATATSSVRLSPLLSVQVTEILSPTLAPFTRRPRNGSRETAWLHWASSTVLPLCVTTTFWMKCTAIRSPFASLRCPVSMGWRMRMRTSATSPWMLARILIGSDIFRLLVPIVLAAAADRDFDFLRRRIELAVRLDDRTHVRGLSHLDAHRRIAFGAVRNVER